MVFALMAAGAVGLRAQDLKVTVPDGPAPKADTLVGRPEGPSGAPERPAFFRFYRTPSRLAPSPFSSAVRSRSIRHISGCSALKVSQMENTV